MKEFVFAVKSIITTLAVVYIIIAILLSMNTIQIIILSALLGLLLAVFIWMMYSRCQLTKRHMENEKRIKYLQEKYGASEN